jgi:hypothetical protein
MSLLGTFKWIRGSGHIMNLENSLRVNIKANQVQFIVKMIKNQYGNIDDRYLEILKTESSPDLMMELILNEIQEKDYNYELIHTLAKTLENIALETSTDEDLKKEICSVFIEALHSPDSWKEISNNSQLFRTLKDSDTDYIGKKISKEHASDIESFDVSKNFLEYWFPANDFWTYSGFYNSVYFVITVENNIIQEIDKIGYYGDTPPIFDSLLGFPRRLNNQFHKIMQQIIIEELMSIDPELNLNPDFTDTSKRLIPKEWQEKEE